MARKDYYPTTDPQVIPWFKNFIEKVQTHAATLGITGAQITGFQSDCDDARTRLEDVTSKKTTLQSVVQAKDTALAAIEKRTRDAVVIIKRNANYTEAIGEDLGVVAADDSAAFQALLTTAKPEFVATILPDKVRLDWAKGHFDGVVVQGKRGSEANFAKLDNDTRSPYEDARRNVANDTPETRTYRMRYVYKDQEVGLWSNEVKVTCLV